MRTDRKEGKGTNEYLGPIRRSAVCSVEVDERRKVVEKSCF